MPGISMLLPTHLLTACLDIQNESERKIYKCVKHGDSNTPKQIKYESANSEQKQEISCMQEKGA